MVVHLARKDLPKHTHLHWFGGTKHLRSSYHDLCTCGLKNSPIWTLKSMYQKNTWSERRSFQLTT
ncbi:hypothetical protein RSAG8_11729, partial [Rhizoctonia solani AG-8 WAC10335]